MSKQLSSGTTLGRLVSYITETENGDARSWKNILPELAQWAGRRGWHFPPPLSSGRHLSSVQHIQWCPWADDGRIPEYLEWQEMKQHTTMIIVQKPRRISIIELFVQHFNVQSCSKHPPMPMLHHWQSIANTVTSGLTSSPDPHYVQASCPHSRGWQDHQLLTVKPGRELRVQNISNLQITKPST